MSRTKGCMFSRIINEGDQQDQEAVQSLLNSDKTNTDIARDFTEAGYAMSEHAVRRHRKADCSCGWL